MFFGIQSDIEFFYIVYYRLLDGVPLLDLWGATLQAVRMKYDNTVLVTLLCLYVYGVACVLIVILLFTGI